MLTSEISLYQKCGKRLFDTLLIILAAPIAGPLIGILALLIWIAMGKPVFFRQVRPGKDGRPFTVYKLRTMIHAFQNSDSQTDEQRLTKIGRFLRSSSLDELPELWNVLRGDMSLVGPRPLLMEYLECYSATEARRHEALPGITGWAQINGRNALSWREKFELDVWYVDHIGFLLDLKILLKTFTSVIARKGISAPNHATMPKFAGNKGS